ncbi:MAG: biopolymer transporter ExbD [Planctomycetota bacterium]
MKHPISRSRSQTGFDSKMTPMIDVIFLLLIFFLCTAGFKIAESVLPTRLPTTGAVDRTPSPTPTDLEAVRVLLRGAAEDCQVELNGRVLAGIPDLIQSLRKLGSISKDLPVVLDIGPEVQLGNVVHVYDGCLSAGLSRIHFAAKTK